MAKAKKQKSAKTQKRSKKQEAKDHLAVIMERVEGKVDLYFESQQATNKKLDDFMVEMHSFKDQTEENFKAVFGYLSRVEDDLAEIKKLKKEVAQIKKDQKADKNWIKDIERRLERLEKNFQKQKSVCDCG